MSCSRVSDSSWVCTTSLVTTSVVTTSVVTTSVVTTSVVTTLPVSLSMISQIVNSVSKTSVTCIMSSSLLVDVSLTS